MKKMNNLLWIDVLKGIGIVFVVIGHIYINDISKYIYLFHMLFFLFIGGYLYKIKKNQKIYLENKIKHLIIPYLSFLFLLYFIPLLLKIIISHDISLFLFFKDTIKDIVGGRLLVDTTGVFCFITVFFFTQQIINYLLNKFSLKIVDYIVFVFLVLSYINYLYLPWFWLPLNANVIFASIPLFYIGYRIRREKIHINKILTYVIFFISFFMIYLGYNNTYDMKYAKYGILVITLISSISCVYILIYLAKYLSAMQYLYLPFKQLGLASMVIMYLYQPITISLNLLQVFNGHQEFILLIAIIIPYIAYILFRRYDISKKYLLGIIPPDRKSI